MSSVMPARSSLIGKLERIEQLAEHRLNTPRMMLIPVGSTFDAELVRCMHDIVAGDRLMTVRTYHSTDEITFAKGPFAPEVPVPEAMRLAEELSREWNVLFQEAIDVDATILAGNIALSADGAGGYEALAGAHRVRDVEDPPAGAEADMRCGSFANPREIAEPRIRHAVERVLQSGVLETVSDGKRILLEFNVQRAPVGRRREPLLFWEWRPLPSRFNESLPATHLATASQGGDLLGVGLSGFPGPPGAADLETTLGGKGAGLTRALGAELPVPPFIVLSAADVESWGPFWARRSELDHALEALDRASTRFLGGRPGRRLAVRSSPSISMPGMLDTVLDVEPDADSVERAIRHVLDSWESNRAREFRRAHAITERAGLAVILQPMVAATAGSQAGSGVGFTRHPTTGVSKPEIEYIERELGTNLVGGDALPLTTTEFESRWPERFQEIIAWCPVLEGAQGDMQEFEFAIEDGRPYLLQTRRAKRTPTAALRAAHDLFRDGVINLDAAKQQLVSSDAAHVVERHLATNGATLIGTGRVASPGVAVGRAALDAAGAERIIRAGDEVILLSRIPSPSDYPLLRRSAAVVSSRGGITSHASVVALDAGIVAVVGCRSLLVEESLRTAHFGDIVVREGDWLSIDTVAADAAIYLGRLSEEAPSAPGDLPPAVLNWARSLGDAR